MSAPRPYKTDPFHPPALFLSYTGIIFCIYAKDFHRFYPYGNHIASWYNVDLSFRHALLQNHLLRSQPFGGHEKIMKFLKFSK